MAQRFQSFASSIIVWNYTRPDRGFGIKKRGDHVGRLFLPESQAKLTAEAVLVDKVPIPPTVC